MKRLYLVLFTLIATIAINSCSSGKKAYEQGNYYQAVVKAVNRLRSNPGHKKSKETLKHSYPLAVENAEKDMANILDSDAPFKYRTVLRSYEQINAMYEEIRRSPGALKVVPNPKNYYPEVAKHKGLAAEESYAAGIVALERDTREDAKQAVYLFRDVQSFVPGYKDALTKIEEAMFKATLKVVVDQIPVPTAYTLSANFFQNKVEEHLYTQFRSTEFVRFYTPTEAEHENLPYIDQYLRIQFDDFVVGETHLVTNIETLTKDSVVVGSVTLENGSKVDAYNTVKAKLTVNHKEVISNGLLSMRVFDGRTSAVLTHQKFNGEFIWFSEWGSFNGDERALTDEQIKICNSSEVPPPPPQDLFVEFTRPIYSQLVTSINSFYARY
ncbi:MAG: hypothetical protein AAGA64_10710 [Bacteroidota bacterium]